MITNKRLRSLTFRLFLTLVLAVLIPLLLTFIEMHGATAQTPTPSSYFQNVAAYERNVPSGAGAVAVYGLGAGLGGCSYSVSEIIEGTRYFLGAGVKTATEITVQSDCDPDISHWETVVTQIVDGVKTHPNASTLWAGLMLDEESNFWKSSSSVDAFTRLNQHTYYQVIGTPGITYFFGEVFSSAGDWNQSQFNQVMSYPNGAPQIATQYMVDLTNNWPRLPGTAVTYGPGYPPGFRGLNETTGRINGAPYYQWGTYWANCFTLDGSCPP